jgi:hypothetical protein
MIQIRNTGWKNKNYLTARLNSLISVVDPHHPDADPDADSDF